MHFSGLFCHIKQSVVARSSTDAEYRSLALATAEVTCIQSLLTELKVPHAPPVIFCDNMSTVSLAHNPVLHSRTKHIELDYRNTFLSLSLLPKSLYVGVSEIELGSSSLLRVWCSVQDNGFMNLWFTLVQWIVISKNGSVKSFQRISRGISP